MADGPAGVVCLLSAVTVVAGCLFGLVPSGRRQWWWLDTFPAPGKFLGPATLAGPPKFLVTVRSSPFGYRCAPAPRRAERGGAGMCEVSADGDLLDSLGVTEASRDAGQSTHRGDV